jgi:hypothetical protein
VAQPESSAGAYISMIGVAQGVRTHRSWELVNISFLCGPKVGTLICDTGASVTAVSLAFTKAAKLALSPLPPGAPETVKVPGFKLPVVGRVNLPISIQLMLEIEDGQQVHWDRRFTLSEVWVVDMGEDPPQDLYVAYTDWAFDPKCPDEHPSPLSELAYMVSCGATVYNSPRAVYPDNDSIPVVALRRKIPTIAALSTDADIRKFIMERIPESKRGSAAARRLVEELLLEKEVFGDIDPSKCTEIVEFVITGKPEEVTFKSKAHRKVGMDTTRRVLEEVVDKKLAHWVPWSEPAYGFVIVVPKPSSTPGGPTKFKIITNPVSVNKVTKRIDPEGGFMPDYLVTEAQKAGRRKVGAKMDLKSAYSTLGLAPATSELSTFTSAAGKIRFTSGYYGWHSFPAIFQQLMMQKVVLPAADLYGDKASFLAWIDDLVPTADDDETLVDVVVFMVKAIRRLGGRLALDKLDLLVDRFEWCGIEVDLPTNSWRVAPGRVSSLSTLPIPGDKEALTHMLGIVRYYYFCVTDHAAQRERLAILAELDKPGTRVADLWKERHTTAMREALAAISKGEWLLAYDPLRPVVVTTDASGNHGYGIIANQYDGKTGKMRPILFISRPWVARQMTWPAQVKEAFAQRQAVCVVMPRYFPYANVILLTDNRNLAGRTASADPRVQRWQDDIRDSGAIERAWVPGEWNAIADYASRVAKAEPLGTLPREEEFENYIYFMGTGGEGTVPEADAAAGAGDRRTLGGDGVATEEPGIHSPGHLLITPMLAKIADAQAEASKEERDTWTGKRFSTVSIGGKSLMLYRGRIVVPRDAEHIKQQLMKMSHDDTYHYAGAERTQLQLMQQARVFWQNMQHDVNKYVKQCHRCRFAKAPHTKAAVGQLTPTIPPYVNHTWYLDLKGPMPLGTGYIMAIVEGVSRYTKLRYCINNTAKEIIEELDEAVASFGTLPVVLRTDGGPPFDSDAIKQWCSDRNVSLVVGVPYHSQAQGTVETRFRTIAAALIATLGGKAPRAWWEGMLLAKLEAVINTTICENIRGTPYWAMYSREARTALSANLDWTNEDYGGKLVGESALTYDDIHNIIGQHHAAINAVQQRVSMASCLAQAMTKTKWDATRDVVEYKVGDMVLLHRTAPNRMTSHFTGPYRVKAVSSDKNFVALEHFLGSVPGVKEQEHVHVARLIPFNDVRATKAELTDFHLDVGSMVAEEVLAHQTLEDGSNEFQIKWHGTDKMVWSSSSDVKKIAIVQEYCKKHGLPMPGVEPRRSGGFVRATARRATRGGRSGAKAKA